MISGNLVTSGTHIIDVIKQGRGKPLHLVQVLLERQAFANGHTCKALKRALQSHAPGQAWQGQDSRALHTSRSVFVERVSCGQDLRVTWWRGGNRRRDLVPTPASSICFGAALSCGCVCETKGSFGGLPRANVLLHPSGSNVPESWMYCLSLMSANPWGVVSTRTYAKSSPEKFPLSRAR